MKEDEILIHRQTLIGKEEVIVSQKQGIVKREENVVLDKQKIVNQEEALFHKIDGLFAKYQKEQSRIEKSKGREYFADFMKAAARLRLAYYKGEISLEQCNELYVMEFKAVKEVVLSSNCQELYEKLNKERERTLEFFEFEQKKLEEAKEQ